MGNKQTKLRLLVASCCVVGLGVLVFLVLTASKNNSGVIPPSSSLEQARQLSQDVKKEACLTADSQAAAAVKRDDAYLDDKQEFSKFALTASGGLMDVPAGASYGVTINNYDGNQVKGAVMYEKDYGSYNYIIKKLANAGEWKFVSMVACTRP